MDTISHTFCIIAPIIIEYFIKKKPRKQNNESSCYTYVDDSTKVSNILQDFYNLMFSNRQINHHMMVQYLKNVWFSFRGAMSLRPNLRPYILKLKYWSLKTQDYGYTNFVELDQIIKLSNSLRELDLELLRDSNNSLFVPSTVRSITLSQYFNKKISFDVSQNKLNELIFGRNFNQEYFDLPKGLIKLKFGWLFDQKIKPDILPTSLLELVFIGGLFNQMIDPGIFPLGLTKLTFGSQFNQQLFIGSLPPNLIELKFTKYSHFDQILAPKVLPDTLKKLEFGYDSFFNKDLEPGVLPQSLTDLVLSSLYNYQFKINSLPHKLKNLKFRHCFDQSFMPGTLPQSLGSLILGSDYNQPIEPNILPDGLFALKFGTTFNQRIKHKTLPQSLMCLQFGDEFNKIIEHDSFPVSLTYLEFGDNYQQRLDPGVLTCNLICLKFGRGFNQKIIQGILPDSLRRLEFNYFYNKSLNACVLPKGLLEIVINKYTIENVKFQQGLKIIYS